MVAAAEISPTDGGDSFAALGAGAGGLVTSYIAAAVKAKVALIEKHKMGGDCLNSGCVPSKALIRSARFAAEQRKADELGFSPSYSRADFAAVMARVAEVIKDGFLDRHVPTIRALYHAQCNAMLAALQAKHPDLRMELVTSNALQDLVRREVDIAVRMTPPQQDVLLATRVGDVELGLHAHRSYLERHGQPASVADLAHHVLIGFDRETPFLRSAATRLPIWQRDNFHWRCDSDLAQLALLRAGAGIGVCQTALARRDPNLVRVLPTRLSMKLTTWVAMHEGLRNSPRCKAAFDALVKGLRRYVK